eukprot:GFKZ01008906.1.p1 GENE.GFKZ01008906.1~~GFKZ01008906.1.p1  ORF type:complete len:459 (-),score=93.13 GFKZ01008906.1:459-1835(-)
MTHFQLDESTREALTPSRAEALLLPLTAGVSSAKLSGKSFGDGSAAVAATALQRAIPTLRRLDLADIIASRPEEEAKRVLSTIADALDSCKHLVAIDLSDNALGAKGIHAVGGLLAGQRELEELYLCNNGLAADAGELISSALLETKPTSLKVLHFHNNLLETAGSVALAPVVENSPSLTDFRFSSLRLGRDGAVRICQALEPRVGLTIVKLNLSDNTFGEEGAEALAKALSHAPQLEELLLRDDMLGDDGITKICKLLVNGAPVLKVLDVSGNEIGVDGANMLGKLIGAGRLRVVLAEDNEMGNTGATRLAKGISDVAVLEELNLSSCEIGGRGGLALARAVGKVEALVKLTLDGNEIPGEAVSEITDCLGEKLGAMDDNDDEAEDDDDEDDEDDEDDNEDDDGGETEEVVDGDVGNGKGRAGVSTTEGDGKIAKGIEAAVNSDIDALTQKVGDIEL